jgi:hypothetical protein
LAWYDLATLVAFEISTEFIVICSIVGGLILVSLVSIIGGFLHSRRERLLVHAERMKALELGRDMPDDPATMRMKAIFPAEKPEESASQPTSPAEPKSLAAQCYSTTGWVAGCGLLFAAWSSMPGGHSGVAYAIAGAAGAVGVTGMICGTILASKPTISNPTEMLAHAKPRFDPEAV